jgi:hypothetical protein
MAMSGPNMQAAEFQFRCRELLRRIQDELKARVLFSIAPDKQQFVTALNLFGAEVTTAFPSASYDIEEAAHCLAFDRWTAAVFHLARAAEIATVIIGRQVGYQSPKEGFGEVLRYMDNGLRKAREHHKEADPLFTGDLEFLSGVTAQMHAVNQRIASEPMIQLPRRLRYSPDLR